MESPIYLDNQATTRVDPRVVEAMLPYFLQHFGNAGSASHAYGWQARDAVDAARTVVAESLGASPREIVFTSGATESNNLAIKGVCERPRRRGNHVISVVSEHRAVLDPLARLGRRGFTMELLPVQPQTHALAGQLDLQRLVDALRADTLLVSVMLVNNEIGVLQPLEEISALCRERGVLVHCDATQAVGKLPVDVRRLGVDLLSFSAHKFHGPKGVGGLYVRRCSPPLRLEPLCDGGGQELGLRSGTLNVPGIVGLATALQLALAEGEAERARLRRLRDDLFAGLQREIPGVELNGPALDPSLRWVGNLNCRFACVDGEALMMNLPDVAVSSGSACTSTNPEPSHVLQALGLDPDQARSSLRFGLGRFNTADEIARAVESLRDTVLRLRRLSSLA
ncbi:MAG: aminotransferase class V-fold PLP-dependent enzyme [Pirellulales bacterium]